MTQNRFVASLPAPEREQVAASLQLVNLTQGTVLFQPGQPIRYVHFPITALSSIIVRAETGASVEAAAVGCEGVTGLPESLGDGISFDLGEIQVAGAAWQMDAGAFREWFGSAEAFRRRVVQYMGYMSSQARRSILCNRIHGIDERTAKWLLIAADGAQSDSVALTQEYLGTMLGVHRPIVSGSASALREAGSIDYSRGQIRITDRRKLESFACECYRVLREHRRQYLCEYDPTATR